MVPDDIFVLGFWKIGLHLLIGAVLSSWNLDTGVSACSSPPTVTKGSYSPIQGNYSDTETVTYSCDTGYNHTAGNLILECNTGSWVGTAPTCTIKTCTPDTVPNSSKSPDLLAYDYSTNVTYTCEEGYEHASGNLTRTCTASETWNGVTPNCSIKTCTPDAVSNSSKSPDLLAYDYNTNVTYTCDVGYEHASGNLTRTCTASETWSGVTPNCSIITCVSEAAALATISPAAASHDYNTIVTYTCSAGYYITSGSATRTCLASSAWSGTLPVCSLVTCAPDVVAFSTKSPSQTSYDYNTNVTYACITGYEHTSGALVRTCLASAAWSLTVPVCSIKTCTPDAVSNSSKSPDLLAYDYNTNVTYTCDVGYEHASGDLTRTCTASETWSGVTPNCSIVTCAPDVVAFSTKSPNQTSYDYNTNVTYACITGYEHTNGALVRTCLASAAWSLTVPVCSIITCVPEAAALATISPAAASHDYNTIVTYTCSAGYYITSGSATRTCLASSAWSGTLPVCSLVTCTPDVVAFSTKSPNQTSYDYNTNVTYACITGYEHTSGALVRTCLASAAWSLTVPVCSIITCVPEAAALATISPAAASHDYNTIVTYTCAAGYYITSGSATRTCLASSAWSGTLPVCSLVTCTPDVVAFSTKSSNQTSYDYNTNVTYTCITGYEHTSGALVRTCLASAAWSLTAPVCSIKKCTPDTVPNSNEVSDQFDYNTQVVYSCAVGYYHYDGDLTRTCLDDETWNGTAPNCTIVTCGPTEDAAHAQKTPLQSSYDYNTHVIYTCLPGYKVDNGDVDRACTAAGIWSGVTPVCINVTCTAPSGVAHSSVSPDEASYSYDTLITYTCDTGYEHTSGSFTRTCQQSETFNGTAPVCSIKTCSNINVTFGFASPDQSTYDYNTNITYACDLSYNHTAGDLVRTCDATANWTGTLPTCTVAACLPDPVPFSTLSPNETIYEFGTSVTYVCTLGYYIETGDEVRTCRNTGLWNGTAPTCSLVRCDSPDNVNDSTYTPISATNKHDYNTHIAYTCNLAYNHTAGDLNRTCNEEFTWTGAAPVCTVAACIQENSTHMTTTPNQVLHQFDDVIVYQCITGYNHSTGDPARTCLNTGQWSGTLPSCVIVECDMPPAIANSTVAPTQGVYVYQDMITYTCITGYEQTSGDASRTCTETSEWTGTAPVCTIIHCPPPSNGTRNIYAPIQVDYEWQTLVEYFCDFGYNHSTGDQLITCHQDKTWTGTTPVCTIIQCQQFTVDHATVFPLQSLHDFNTFVTTTCVTGYNMTNGDAVRTCNVSGTWGGAMAVCTIITCVQPTTPPYCSISPNISESDYNTDITYTCDLGYNRTAGDGIRRCNETGEWNGVEANCTLVTCIPPEPVQHATYDPDIAVYNYSSTATFTCDFGYYHVNGTLVRTCDENAEWTGVKPVCSIVQCPHFAENHSMVLPVQLFHDFNTSVTTTCVIGYNLTGGDVIRTCTASTAWDGEPPVCSIVECDMPPAIANSTVAPTQGVYVYLDVITYTCVTGYEQTSGDASRNCTETSEWTGEAAVCTIIHCPKPSNGTRNTYSPVQLEYEWQTIVEYSCDTGYNRSTGDQLITCHHDKTWTGTTPVCIIVTCDKIDVPHMTFTPPTTDTHDFNTTIEYACDVGYNHSHGDLRRTCNYTGVWTGELPNCTIITCDPPDPIPHTYYSPVYIEHDWNTAIMYECDAGYHYVSGVNRTTCNETGVFPPADFNCSVLHIIVISASEPAITWMNTTANTSTILFDFDGLCDVRVTSSPALLNVSYVRLGKQIIVSVEDMPNTNFDVYQVSLDAFRNGRTWPRISRTLFYGEEVLGFKAWLDNEKRIIVVGQTYAYIANLTQGTGVTLDWLFFDSVNVSNSTHYQRNFPIPNTSTNYAYASTGNYTITAVARNLVSSLKVTIDICVIHVINGITLSVNNELRSTTQMAHLTLAIEASALLPMGYVNFVIDFKNGNFEQVVEPLPVEATLPVLYEYDVLYTTQGYYNVTAIVENAVSSTTLSKFMRVWDNITDVELACTTPCHALITSKGVMTAKFMNVPKSGFEYLIDFKDGNTNQSENATVLYSPNTLTEFENVFTSTGVYDIYWMVKNGEYFKNGNIEVIVQNEIIEYQAWLNNDIMYLAVGRSYTFEANATHGTNVTVHWQFEMNVTRSTTYPGKFTYGNKAYTYNSPGTYNVTVTASNLVSSESKTIPVIVIYVINNIQFDVDRLVANTTQDAVFSLTVMAPANLTMDEVRFSINYANSTNISDTNILDSTLVLPAEYLYKRRFDVQGEYVVAARVENILGFEDFTITLKVWDTLDPLELIFVNSNGKYITNTTTEIAFANFPNAGFKYFIDFGDGVSNASVGDDILYDVYKLTNFSHVYTSPDVYTVKWTAENGYYSQSGNFPVLVQNRVPTYGYTLEPMNTKYPSINLQNMDISVNITLNETVPLPTNATCIFEARDGSESVSGLKYDNAFFEHRHRYSLEGLFNSTVNCSNEVSYYVYEYNLKVQKYESIFLSVIFEPIVPLNVSDTVTVYFHIDNGGFALIPLRVTLDWNYGDGTVFRRRRSPIDYGTSTFSNLHLAGDDLKAALDLSNSDGIVSRRRRAPVNYYTPMYIHMYSARGDYVVVITVYAEATNTTNTLTYPLRLGIMHFEYTGTVAFLNTTNIRYTMYGVLGTYTTYTIFFDDGTPNGVCNSVDYNGCYIDHLCPNVGYKDVNVIASNGTFVEVDKVNITCDNPIPEDLTLDMPSTVAIPDGWITLKLKLKVTDLFLPMLYCNLNMGDDIKRTTYTLNQTVTFNNPFTFLFQYIALGRHDIDIHCWNLINNTNISYQITVTNKDFLFLGLFDRTYSQANSPLLISSMRDTEVFNRAIILASYKTRTHVNKWVTNATTNEVNMNRHGLLFTIGMTEEKQYYTELLVSFKENPNNVIFEPTYIKVIMPPPHAEIQGGTRRIVNQDNIVVDAASLSYDPAHPTVHNVDFRWSCESYNAVSFEDASLKHNTKSGAQSCSPYNEPIAGQLILNTNTSPVMPYYVVTVTVDNRRGATSTFTQVMKISTSSNGLSIRCKINCLSKVAVSSNMQLVASISNNCPATFIWKLQEKSGSTYGPYKPLSSMTKYGVSGPSLTISENHLTTGTWYLVTLYMTQNGTIYGPAYYEFVTNRLPQGGSCGVVPYDEYFFPLSKHLTEYVANKQKFNITCSKWTDEGFTDATFSKEQPLFYYFFLTYSDDDTQRQILYFDPGATSNLVTFQVGDGQRLDKGYNATLVMRITDVIGDYAELKHNVVSKPSLTQENLDEISSAAHLDKITEFIEQFDEELIKANTSYDYRTLSRTIQGIASVYNALELVNTQLAITLVPEDLVSLGYKQTDDGKQISWSDYWKLIVEVIDTSATDYLITTGERYTLMLYNNIIAWPVNKRMTLVAIETVSRALNATMAKTEYANDTAAITAAKAADILARNLADNVNDRTFPHTAQVFSAAIGVNDLIRNVLAELQTILTPNLPQDPTVDQMRYFLEYIRIFKKEEAVQGEPLSLQEQTFLAQKQLQKYYLQKYVKSKSSQKALPFLTYALRNLTYVLSKLSHIGQNIMYLENDFIYISTETKPAYALTETTVYRPHDNVGFELNSMTEVTPEPCGSSAVNIKTVVFKTNPYFWGQFGDRITSYVPIFHIDGATLTSPTITYRLQNAVEPACIDEEPTYDADDPDKMIYILFDRRFGEDDILLFVKPNASLVYQLYFNVDVKPSILEKQYIYSTEMKTDKWTQEDGYKLLIKSSDFSAVGKIWIALRPLLKDSDADSSLLKKPFCANVTSVNCLSWRQGEDGEYFWDKEMCEVSRTSTLKETVCVCKNPGDTSAMTVGTTFYVPPNKIDFLRLSIEILPDGRWPVLGMIIATMCAYVLLVCWAWREDAKDQYKWSYSLLIDNDIADSHFYIIRVYTGLRTGAGTQSRIGFILVGEENETGERILDDNAHVGFERASVRTLVMSCRRNLGDLVCLRIWHDDTGGNESSWYLNKITVLDMQTDKRYAFVCNNCFDYDRGDTKVDRVLNACPIKEPSSFKEMASYTIAENHLWLSVTIRPMKSNFTRIQRISCLLGFIYMTMVILTIVLKTSDTESNMTVVAIGPFRFSQEGFKGSMVAASVSTVIISLVAFFFRNSKAPKMTHDVNSIFRKAYRAINDRLQIDKSYLGRAFTPPAEDALVYDYHFLPHMCVYVGWGILVVVIGMATSLLILFSEKWKLVKSEEWMTSVFVALMGSILILEMIKIIIILMLYSLMCKRAYEVPEPNIDVDRLVEITKHNSATLTIGPQFSNILHTPQHPDDETLLAHKIKRIGDHQLLKLLYQLSLYSGLLFIVYTISYESRDPRSFYLKDHINNTFNFQNEVKDMTSYTKWLNDRFVKMYFSGTYYGANLATESVSRMFGEDLANLRVGPARLRQLRIKPEACKGPLGVNLTCHTQFKDYKSETTDFCLNWKPQPCDVSEKSKYFTSAGWLYKSADEVWGLTTIATYATFGGGGYFLTLDVNKDVCEKLFEELIKFNWFDRQTRAVILEFTFYNGNSNLFAYSKFVAEFPEVGGVLTYMDIQVFRLYTHIGPNGSYVMFLEFFFLLIVLVATVNICCQIIEDARTFFKSIWNWLDCLALVMSFITISVFILKIFIIQKTIDIFQNDKNAYVGFENLALYDFVVNTTHGVLVFILSIRVSRILGYSGKINEMAAVITKASSDLFGFLIIFGITYFTYVAFGTLLFGKETAEYRTLFATYGTVTEAVVGKNQIKNILRDKPGFAEFYYFTFVLFVLMTLATMASAILNLSISQVKEEQHILAPSNIVDVIFERISKVFRRFGRKQDEKVKQRKGSEVELHDILMDFRLFMDSMKTNYTIRKPSDKYRILTPESSRSSSP